MPKPKITITSMAERYRMSFDKLYLDQTQEMKDRINKVATDPDLDDREVDAFVKLVIEEAELEPKPRK